VGGRVGTVTLVEPRRLCPSACAEIKANVDPYGYEGLEDGDDDCPWAEPLESKVRMVPRCVCRPSFCLSAVAGVTSSVWCFVVVVAMPRCRCRCRSACMCSLRQAKTWRAVQTFEKGRASLRKLGTMEMVNLGPGNVLYFIMLVRECALV
jgi:hypothetical protein